MEVAEKATVYRLGNSTIRLQGKTLFGLVTIASCAVLYILYILLPGNSGHFKANPRFPGKYFLPVQPYNKTYPLTNPVKLPGGWIKYRIGVIADMDLKSKSLEEEGSWISYLKTGDILYNPESREIKVEWEPAPTGMTIIKSSWSYGNRGMELSELLVFNGKLYGIDDRTGVVYEIDGSLAIPWVILTDGNGRHAKG
jgi:soluble calcium-activated nucleotidase 1